jgi:hypothetical protein
VKNILLYGDSILLTGLAAQLQDMDEMSIRQQSLRVGPLNLHGLDVVIVDFNAVDADAVLDILRAQPDIKVVGVNPDGGAVTVLSGRVYLVHTLNDVMTCLE